MGKSKLVAHSILAALAVLAIAGAIPAGASPVLSDALVIVKTGWTIGCTPVSTFKDSTGGVWGIEDCQGLEQRTYLGHP
jgi:hypothetical protein